MPKRPRIALLGPVLPYRSGIAQYTTQLHQALQQCADVVTVSFKRQYPKFLYPGETDITPGMENYQEPGVTYSLDIYNPFSWRKAANEIIKSDCDLAVLTWWTLIWQPGFAYMARRLRKHGVKTVFLCHNLFNHKTGGLMGLVDKIMYPMARWMLRQADAYIVQASEKQAELREIKPGAEILFRLHPIYDRFPPATEHWAPRGRLDLLFFGLIRPYKGLDILLESLAKLKDNEICLTIAGEAWGDVDALRQQLTESGVPNLESNLRFISDVEAANYISRADALVLPYRSATGSGVAAVAYNYGKPVIATKVGSLADIVVDGKTGFLVPPNDPDALASAIQKASRQELQAMRPAIEKFSHENSWGAMAQAICGLANKAE